MDTISYERKFLVMDDDEEIGFIASHKLEQLGFNTVLTANGTETVARFREALEAGEPFVALILDINIPGGPGGFKVLQQIREIDPRATVFISSGNPSDPMMIDPVSFGFNGAIDKTYSTEALIRLLSPKFIEPNQPCG